MNSLVVTLKYCPKLAFRRLLFADLCASWIRLLLPRLSVVSKPICSGCSGYAYARAYSDTGYRSESGKCSREGGDDDEFLSESLLRSNEMEVVGVSPPLSKRPM